MGHCQLEAGILRNVVIEHVVDEFCRVSAIDYRDMAIPGTPAAEMHRFTVETLKQGYVEEIVTSDSLMKRLTAAAVTV